jgi:hypothetical protein
MEMSHDFQAAMQLLGAKLSTCVQRVDYPMHKGAPNPAHGKFFFVGHIPAECYDVTRNNGRGGSRFYDTEEQAISAAFAAGVESVQRTDYTFTTKGD